MQYLTFVEYLFCGLFLLAVWWQMWRKAEAIKERTSSLLAVPVHLILGVTAVNTLFLAYQALPV